MRYIFSIIGGLFLGILAMMAVAILPVWNLPAADAVSHAIGISSASSQLDYQSVITRFCEILTLRGTLFLAVPVILALAFTVLESIGRSHKWAWQLAFAIQATICLTAIGGVCWNFYVAAKASSGAPLETILITAMTNAITWVWDVWSTGKALALCVVMFLLAGFKKHDSEYADEEVEDTDNATSAT